MLDRKQLEIEMLRKDMTHKELARRIGITPKTFSLKLKSGKFGLDEADKMIKVLDISDPTSIFFPNTVA